MEYIPSFRDQFQNGNDPSYRDNIDNELYHYGVKGMRWGVRRYQNSDGSLTPAGQKRKKKLLRAVKSAQRDAKAYRKTADEYEKYGKAHGPILKATSQAIADQSRAYARAADRDAKLNQAKLTFDKNKISKARKEWMIDVAKDATFGPTARETYTRNRKAGKGRINSAMRGTASALVTAKSYPEKGYVYKPKQKR